MKHKRVNRARTFARCERETGLHFTMQMTGKMRGMKSLSSSVVENPICACRRKVAGSICEHCFAEKMHGRFSDLAKCTAENTAILTSRIVADDLWPEVEDDVFRIESFGDVANETQAENYVRFIASNPQTRIAVWTKNVEIYDPVLRRLGKPANMIFIQSSMFLNAPEKPRSEYVDYVFTVFTQDYADAHGIVINCGARLCLACQRCYKKPEGGKVRYINEILK